MAGLPQARRGEPVGLLLAAFGRHLGSTSAAVQRRSARRLNSAGASTTQHGCTLARLRSCML